MRRSGSITDTEKKFRQIQRKIVQLDKRQRRLLQSIDLAIERITTGASIAELAKRLKPCALRCALTGWPPVQGQQPASTTR